MLLQSANRLTEPLGIRLDIVVQKRDESSARVGEAEIDAAGHATVPFQPNHAHLRKSGLKPRLGSVSRGVIDQDNLTIPKCLGAEG